MRTFRIAFARCKKSGQRFVTVNFRFVGKAEDYPETGFGKITPTVSVCA
ncbi:MAG: hypothetical protein WCD47_11965 [Candidatus Sulfotelmatobacter sp.]